MFFYINFDKAMNNSGLTNTKLSEILNNEYSFNISKESIGKYRKGTRTPEPQFIYFISKILPSKSFALHGFGRSKTTNSLSKCAQASIA